MDNTRSHKNEVIGYVLETCGLQDRRGECVMIGDRRQDVIGARQTGLDCIAVRYGRSRGTGGRRPCVAEDFGAPRPPSLGGPLPRKPREGNFAAPCLIYIFYILK